MPKERPVPDERVFLIRLKSLTDTLPPPQCVAHLLAPRSLRMILLPEIADDMHVVVEQELPNMPPHDVYDRIAPRQLAPGILRVFDTDNEEKRRYVMDTDESILVERFLQKHIAGVATVLRNREQFTILDHKLLWTFDRLQTADVTGSGLDVVLGTVTYPRDVVFPRVDWVMEEVTDKPLFRLPVRLKPQSRARR